MDKYVSLLRDFDAIFEVAQMFFIKYEELKIQYNSRGYWYFDSSIQYVWDNLTKDKQEEIKNKLELQDNNKVIVKIRDWISWNRYACFSFKEILPDLILKKLESICFPIGSISGSGPDFDIAFLARNLALKICEKLKDKYFQEGAPGIIAISFAMLSPSGMDIIPVEQVVNYLRKTFHSTLSSVMQGKSQEFREKVFSGLKNLYGIIIDANWYNWFPDIVERLHSAQFLDGYNNYYTVIYNETLFSDPEYDGDILALPQIRGHFKS